MSDLSKMTMRELLAYITKDRPDVSIVVNCPDDIKGTATQHVVMRLIDAAPAILDALELADDSLKVGRRFLPSHGTFGEDGLNEYEWSQRRVAVAIRQLNGETP